MIARFLGYAILSLVFKLFVYLTAPVWAAWAALADLDKFPEPFDIVSTHDDDVYGSKTTGDKRPTSTSRRFKRALWWLYRNPGYTFDAKVLGFAQQDLASAKETKPDVWRFVTKDKRKWFYYGRGIDYSGSKHFKIDLGWGRKSKAGYYKINLTIHPFKSDD